MRPDTDRVRGDVGVSHDKKRPPSIGVNHADNAATRWCPDSGLKCALPGTGPAADLVGTHSSISERCSDRSGNRCG
jgi:hypothetical protein